MLVLSIEPGRSAGTVSSLLFCPAVGVCEALFVFVLIQRHLGSLVDWLLLTWFVNVPMAYGISNHGASKRCFWGSDSRLTSHMYQPSVLWGY